MVLVSLGCATAHAQGVAPSAGAPTYPLRADAESDLVEEPSAPRDAAFLLTESERLRVRRALNLEFAGWLTAAISAPGFAMAHASCSRAPVRYRAPASTLVIGISSGLVGTILRLRRTRGHERFGFHGRQGLFRSPAGRAIGFAGLFLGVTAAAVAIPAMEIGLSCTA